MHPELPQSLEAERATLGSCLLNREAIIPIAAYLTPEHFYLEQHAQIYAAMLACYHARQPVDVRTVSFALRKREQLRDIGDVTYLSGLVDGVPTSYHVEYYAAEVLRCARLRAKAEAGGKIAALAWSEDDPDTADAKALELIQVATARPDRAGYQSLALNSAILIERMANPDAYADTTVHTGFLDLDKLTGGHREGDLVVIAADSGMGKTGFAGCIARNLARAGALILFSELEMSRDQLLLRMTAIDTDTNLMHLRANALSSYDDEQLRAITEAFGLYESLCFEVDDAADQSVASIRANARRIRAERGPITALFVDYIQLLTPETRKNGTREQEVAGISRGLKLLARDLGCPVFALAQLNRELEKRADKRPNKADIRESGAIFNDADVLLFIYRDEYYNRESDQKGTAEIIVGKNRSGPPGSILLHFDATTTRFADLTQRSPFGGPRQ